MKSKRIIFRILLLASIAVLMILLCGCRTRLSNNSDVHSKIEDETGYMSENYEYRRDDLGLSVAEKPLINPDNGEDDEDEYNDDFDYEPTQTDPFEDDPTTDDTDTDDDDDDEKTTTRTTSGTTSTTRRQTTTGTRRPSTTTTTTAVKVTLNANGGKCKKTSIYVRKGSTYGSLPTAERDGYKFLGWYTKKEDDKGSKVTSKTKVTLSGAHTLYAHWEVQTTKTYKVSFDGNGNGDEITLDGDSITVEEDGTYGELPKAARTGYYFDGWYTEKEDGKGSKVVKGDKFTANADQTLYAHWDDNHSGWWEDEFKTAANDVTDKDKMPYFIIRDHPDPQYPDCHVSNKDADALKNMVKGIEETVEADADFSILLLDPAGGVFEEIAEAAASAYMNSSDDCKKIIVISKDAIKNSNENLVARIRILNQMYGSNLDADKAAEQLGIDKTLIYVFPPAVGE